MKSFIKLLQFFTFLIFFHFSYSSDLFNNNEINTDGTHCLRSIWFEKENPTPTQICYAEYNSSTENLTNSSQFTFQHPLQQTKIRYSAEKSCNALLLPQLILQYHLQNYDLLDIDGDKLITKIGDGLSEKQNATKEEKTILENIKHRYTMNKALEQIKNSRKNNES